MTTVMDPQIANISRQNTELLGEIISWNLQENTRVPFQDVVQALKDAGLDEGVAREMRNRHAFARAAKVLANERIIRCVEDQPHLMRFQFTQEQRAGDEFIYSKETILRLDKDTGQIQSEDGNSVDLVAKAKSLMDEAKNTRRTDDLSRYIMVLFQKQADLFPVRDAGGVYFVPERHMAFVDRIDQFVTAMKGRTKRFPVPAGTQRAVQSVRDAVQEGLQGLLNEHLLAISNFGTDTRESTFQKAHEKITQTKFKIEAYAAYLGEERDKLLAEAAAADMNLREKYKEILGLKQQATEAGNA